MSNTLVSCIVPVRDGARFVGAAIESILAQTHARREVIVVDDGSTDATPDVLRGFGNAVTAIRQAPAGPAAARNRGIDAARGASIAFLDADDLWSPRKLERQLARLEADPGLGFCVCHVQNFWEAEMADERDRLAEHARARPLPGYVTQALLARRTVFEAIGTFDPDLGHGDAAEWFMRAKRAGIAGVVLEEVLVRRRLHANNLSRRRAPASRGEFLDLVKRALDERRGGRAS